MALLPVWVLSCAVSLYIILPITDAEEIFVRPLEAEDCSSHVPCLTLNEYASDVDQYFVDNTTFTFMSGRHQLNIPLRREEVSNIILHTMDEVVTIQVNFSSSRSIPTIAWRSCHNITVSALNFDVIGFTANDEDFSVLEFVQTSSVFLSDLTLRGSGRWRAIMLRNVDQASISSLSVFGAMSSSGSAVHAMWTSIDFYGYNNFTNNSANRGGGGAIALYICSSNFFEDFSIFSGNYADYGGAMFVSSGSISMSGTITFEDNTAHNGGAIITVNSISSFSLSGKASFINNTATAFGGALYCSGPSNHAVISGMVSFISNTASSGGAVFAINVDNLSVSGSISFHRNTANSLGSEYGYGGAIDVYISSVNFSGNVVFIKNSASRGGALTLQHSICRLSGSILFENNTAIEEGGALLLHNPEARLLSVRQSALYMTRTVMFLTNFARQGGAIVFGENTGLVLNKSLRADFIKNRADTYGGAIFVSDTCTNNRNSCFENDPFDDDNFMIAMIQKCFFELDSRILSDIQLNFSNNLAGKAGAAVFGGNLERCQVNVGGESQDPLFLLQELAASEIVGGDNTTSNISSEPLRVYICDGASRLVSSQALETVRGREMTLWVNIVGQGNGTVPSSVRISLPNNVSVDATQVIQDTGKGCTRVSYRLESRINTTTFTLFPDKGPCQGIGLSSASVNITFLPCPDAFTLKGPACTCEERLQLYDHDVTCNVDDETIFRRSNTFWMGAVYDNDTYKGLTLHSGCPIDYCTSSPVKVTLDSLDVQCDHNRSGILCGSCREGYSIVFDSLHCLPCDNDYLALIVPFAFAGIALVAAILLLKFSATANGTINGLIFYANIVQAYRSIFIPFGHTKNILTVFIAWLNLDLGIEICFYDGMDTYTFTWLQFVFPFYVWILIGVIIIMCHYSQRVSKIFGTNPVAALATLLLLSYSKITYTVIFALSFTKLEYPDDTRFVWLFDGSVPYFQRADHIILGLFAFTVLLLLFFPFTFLLLCGHWLRAYSHWKIFSWINKIMPFLDAYYGPFKKETRYWTGLLLLVRCVSFIMFTLEADGKANTRINLLVLSSIIVCLTTLAWLHRGVYERLYNDVLEGSFILNLCLFTMATFYVEGYAPQAAIAYTSIGIAFATFVCTVLCHSFIILRNTSMWKKFVQKMKLFLNQNACDGSKEQPCESENCDSNVREPSITFLELRESLLDVTATRIQK